MTQSVPAKVVASSAGLGAFIVAVLAGMGADNPTETVLTRAVLSLLACYVVGLIIGGIAERAVAERIGTYVAANKVEEVDPGAVATGLPGLVPGG